MLEPDYVQQDMLLGLPLTSQLEGTSLSPSEKFLQQGGQQECLNAPQAAPSAIARSQGVVESNAEIDEEPEEENDEIFPEADLARELAECSSQEAPIEQSAFELLDASSLNTVLDMLEVIDSVEELSLLETLTPAQKRQVWEATPELTRLKLKTIRTTASPSSPKISAEPTEHPDISPATRSIPEEEDSIEDLAEDLIENQPLPEQLWKPQPQATSLTAPLPQPKLAVGDWVVLHANPKLTAAEMIAIWQVQEIQGQYAQIYNKAIGTRHYPIAWMVIYPKPSIEHP
ncbi:MAG TPA: hypothetical protein V6C65_33570 [Allocoleopsis sp.]